MPPRPRGRPPKKRRNITGLQNNSSLSTVPSVTSFSQGNQAVTGVTEEDDALIARCQESDRLPVRNKKDEASSKVDDSGEETDEEDYAESEWDELDDKDIRKNVICKSLSISCRFPITTEGGRPHGPLQPGL